MYSSVPILLDVFLRPLILEFRVMSASRYHQIYLIVHHWTNIDCQGKAHKLFYKFVQVLSSSAFLCLPPVPTLPSPPCSLSTSQNMCVPWLFQSCPFLQAQLVLRRAVVSGPWLMLRSIDPLRVL